MGKIWMGLVLVLGSLLGLSGCSQQEEPQAVAAKQLLIYCGITMIKPMSQLAQEFEKQHGVKVLLTQGGSQDLYDALKFSRKGDLYLPGSEGYRTHNLAEGLLGESALLGYNRLAMMVAKGNPKNVQPNLQQLVRPDLKVVLGNPQSGSVGEATEKLLKKFQLAEQAYAHASYLTTDSRRLVESIQKGEADLVVNWYALSRWDGNEEYVDVLDVGDDIAQPKKLILNVLTFSQEPQLAKAFLDFSQGARGRQVFYEFGFLTEKELKQLTP